MSSHFLLIFPEAVNQILFSFERKFGIFLTGLILGIAIFWSASFVYAPLSSDPLISHSHKFAIMSQDPFDFSRSTRLQYRILTPLTAYLLHFRGPYLKLFNLGMGVFLLGIIYWYFRIKNFLSDEAFYLSAMVGFSSPILHLLFFPYYTDLLGWVLIFLSIVFINNALVWPTLFSLSIFNHESNIFIFPFLFGLFLLTKPNSKDWRNMILIGTGFLIGFLIFRYFISIYAAPRLTTNFYMNSRRIMRCIHIVFSRPELTAYAFRLFWFFPLFFFGYLIAKGQFLSATWLLGSVFSLLILIFIAADTTRLLGIQFPIVLLSSAVFRSTIGQENFRKVMWILLLVNIFIPVKMQLGTF